MTSNLNKKLKITNFTPVFNEKYGSTVEIDSDMLDYQVNGYKSKYQSISDAAGKVLRKIIEPI